MEKTKKKKKRYLVPPLIAALMIVHLTACGAGESEQNAVTPGESVSTPQSEADPVPAGVPVMYENQMAPAQVYAENVGAVAGIRTESTTTNIFGQKSVGICSGSGFVVSKDGYIVTNYHVVEGARSITVSLHSGEDYSARLVGGYADNDVALLKVDAEDLQAVTIGKADDLVVGEQIVAIGNPLGELTYSMTVGYVSALDREINAGGKPINMLQTDIAINSGNSGGPVFDMNGNVVAIASAKYSGRTGSGAYIEGLSFAIPIDDVLDILRDLDSYGYVKGRPYLGIGVRDMDSSVSEIYGLPAGVMVLNVSQGSCSEKAGVRQGDVLVSLAEREIRSYNGLVAVLRQLRAGETVTAVVYRAGERLELSIRLDEKDTRPPTVNDAVGA